MIWFLSIPVIFYFTFSNLYYSGFPDFEPHARTFLEWAFLIFVGFFIGFLISLVPIGANEMIGSLFEKKGVLDKEYPLIALRQQDGISGNFYFLGSGSFEDRQYYFWYRKDGNAIVGGKTLRDQNVRIYEDSINPRMVTFKEEFTSEWVKKYGWLIGDVELKNNNFDPDFYIPTGSIKEGFQL